MRQLKKIVNIAIDNGLVTGNPFANIKLRFTYEERSYLIQSEIDTLINKDFGMKRREQVKDMFIFSCYSGRSQWTNS